jgi:hypothetical protein
VPSPFPGMDPYLEISGDWRDFHATFINYSREAIADRLPDHYVARIDERFHLLGVPSERDKGRLPDVAVVRTGPGAAPPEPRVGTITLEPVTVPLMTVLEEEIREVWIEIRRRPAWTLVTVIELLSPSNESEPGRSEYLSKRVALIGQPVHLVELDLLVGGRRLPMRRTLPPGHYYAMVARADRRPDCDVYAWTIHDPLPTIPIPLQVPDPDVPLDLAAVFATAFERGRYARSIDYNAPLTIPLTSQDRAWAEELARMPQQYATRHRLSAHTAPGTSGR